MTWSASVAALVAPALAVAFLGGCAPAAVPDTTPAPAARYEPAPTPNNRYVVRRDPGNSLAIPLRRSPANTQAVPVGTSPVRGAIASGFKEAF